MSPDVLTGQKERDFRLRCTKCNSGMEDGAMGLCPACGGILECVYAGDVPSWLRDSIPGKGLSRYLSRLPVSASLCSLGEGDTPLLPAPRLGRLVGLPNLFLKCETGNPTGSFKDRGAAIAVTRALTESSRGILTASTGNAAASLAAYCASQGMDCLVLFNAGSPVTKLRQALAYGARCLEVEGLFEGRPLDFITFLNELSRRLGTYLGFFWAPVNPYLLEGMKTIAYETVEQLGDEAPDVVVTPVGGGDGLVGQWRGYRELSRAGVIGRLPRMIGAQSKGAAPLVCSFLRGEDKVTHIEEARTVASGLQVTFSGDHALLAIRDSGGTAVAVADDEILRHQRLLSRLEGVWVEPSAAAAVAALPSLVDTGLVQAQERVVCVLTGAGFKDRHHDGVSDADLAAQATATAFNLEEIEIRARALLGQPGQEV